MGETAHEDLVYAIAHTLTPRCQRSTDVEENDRRALEAARRVAPVAQSLLRHVLSADQLAAFYDPEQSCELEVDTDLVLALAFVTSSLAGRTDYESPDLVRNAGAYAYMAMDMI